MEKKYYFFKFSVSPWGIYFFFTKKNQSYHNVDFLVLRNFSKEFTAAPMESKDTLQNERDGNFIKLDEQTRLLDQKEYRRNNEFSIQP